MWYRVTRNEQGRHGQDPVRVCYDVWSTSPREAIEMVCAEYRSGHDGQHPVWLIGKAYKIRNQPGGKHYPGVTPSLRVVIDSIAMYRTH